jgi:hypothetical protein
MYMKVYRRSVGSNEGIRKSFGAYKILLKLSERRPLKTMMKLFASCPGVSQSEVLTVYHKTP